MTKRMVERAQSMSPLATKNKQKFYATKDCANLLGIAIKTFYQKTWLREFTFTKVVRVGPNKSYTLADIKRLAAMRY